MDKDQPFSQKNLNDIFRTSPKDPERLISRESSDLEFKESFGWKSIPKYLRTCAAYANAKGGYIVFGIKNRPHKLMGLIGPNLHAFENIDPEKLTRFFNEHFSPEIHWDIQEYELNEKTYGLIYIIEADDKPVVCTKDSDRELKEGDIYYRYRGRSERVKYPELRFILEQKREAQQRLWIQHLSQIAKIGVNNSGILDLQTGLVMGTNSSFIIDESLLSQLSFIKEGEFSEIKGKPTLKLIGSVEKISALPAIVGKKQIVKTKGIRIGDIVLSFLNQEKVVEPIEYIKQICFESTAFLPVYYFIKIAGLNKDTAIEVIESVVSRSSAKAKLIQRLKDANKQKLAIAGTDTPTTKKKRELMEQLKQGKIRQELSGQDLEHCLQAIRTLDAEDVKKHSTYICGLLKTWFNKYYSSAQAPLAGNLRRTICWVDEALFTES